MPRTPLAELYALMALAGGGIVHINVYEVLAMSSANPTLFEAIATYLFPYGTHANRPAAANVPINSLYYETDTTNLYQNHAGTWVQVASIGGGGSTVEISVNGTPTSDQTALDFADTATITWSNPSGGIIEATAAAGSPVYPALTPDDVSNLAGWWKADAIDGLADGDPVASWVDSSGANNPFTEATNKPTYQTSELNGLPIVRFDATNDVLASALSVSNPFTVIMVAKSNQAFYAANPPTRWLQGSNNWLLGVGKNSGDRDNVNVYNGAFIQTLANVVATQGFNIYSLKQSNPDTTLWVNSQIKQFRSADPSAPGTLYLGGGGTTPSQLANADIAELIVYSRLITETERIQVEQHLKNKYAIDW